MRKDTRSRLALKRVCHFLFRTWTEWWLNIRPSCKASYQIGTKSTNIWSKKKERTEKVNRGKEKFHSLWKQKKKSMPCFPFPWEEYPLQTTLSRTDIWYSPTGNSWLLNSTFVYPKDRQGMLTRPLQGKLFRQGSSGDCLGLLHLSVNLQLS